MIATKRTRLAVESPDVRDREAEFAIENLPIDLIEADYLFLRQRLEFRRKCMNQGFDNLLELLELHWKALQAKERKDATPQGSHQPVVETGTKEESRDHSQDR